MSIQDILTYLYNSYGEVTLTKLKEAEKLFSEWFDPFKPFEIFICKIKDVVDIVRATNYTFIPQ